MTDETLTTDAEGRAVLRMERRLTHPPAKVWRALTEPAELSQWYPQRALAIDLRVGGVIRFDMGSDPNFPGKSVMEATITELEQPCIFAFSTPTGDFMANEQDNILRFVLEPDGDGCLLVFTHVFHDRPFAAANAAGWTVCLDAFEAVLDGRAIEWPSSMVETFEHYVRTFDLGAGAAEDTPDGWRVRLDRQLMQQPVDKVWAALVDDSPTVGAPAPLTATTDTIPAGAATAVKPGELLEYEWLDDDGNVAGQVRWELTMTPPGARIILTQTGPHAKPDLRSRALTAWAAHLDDFVKRLLRSP